MIANGKIKVLLVEDDRKFCHVIRHYINPIIDINIIGVAYDGLEGYKKIIKQSPHIIILDLIMPQLDGLSILRKLKNADNTNCRCIMMSPIDLDVVINQAVELNVGYYMIKPFPMEDLVDNIRRLHSRPLDAVPLTVISRTEYQ